VVPSFLRVAALAESVMTVVVSLDVSLSEVGMSLRIQLVSLALVWRAKMDDLVKMNVRLPRQFVMLPFV